MLWAMLNTSIYGRVPWEGAVKTPVRLRHRHKHSQFKKSKTASPQPFQALDLGIDNSS